MQAGAQLYHQGSFVSVPPRLPLCILYHPLLNYPSQTVCLYSLGWPLPSSCRNPEAGIPALRSQEFTDQSRFCTQSWSLILFL